ncbi:meiotic recombination protein DMC1 [Metarhizium robertsii ARSEF 23]|uniref:Meiotic recombination protein DMC1 n=1 Tax=Metarhizium robertsii (strain ARSEF 23 / ATCC MYA-3075) TaxID=655844 RepID=A0A0B2XI15_METRA|nr:meiotic recombination protein DMC1 [Metarhizium robertsii ARSEF 23]KHO11584.1 meiotic recombination protein DMC1 [Metarhizium robertsii ARSEF 23]
MADSNTKRQSTLRQQEARPFSNGNTSSDIENQLAVAQKNDGPPYSVFTPWQKRAIVLGAAVTAFFSPLTAQIYLPALTQLSRDLGVTNTQINLTITTYMIFQGITPMFIGSLADSGGRRPAYVVCFIIYVAANIGLALAPGYSALLGLRCLQSAGSSSTVALCTAVVADVVTSAERGQYVGFTVIPTVLAPSLGPIIGGLLSQYLGWRAIFWFLAIFSGITLVLIIFFFPETCRRIVGDGSLTPPPMYRSVWQSLHLRREKKARRRNGLSNSTSNSSSASKSGNRFKFKPPNVLGSLFLLFERETGLLLWTSSIVFAGFYCIATAMPSLFSKRYGYNEVQVGLMYLPLALGSIGAASIVGPSINWNFKRHCIQSGIPYDQSRQNDLSNFPIEQARLEIGLPLLCLGAVSIIGWGWAMHAATHVAVPCVISFFLGIGMIGYNNTTNILLVDVHPGRAGTATAANNLTRCLVGAGASAAIIPMIDAIGAGPAFTLIGGLYFVGVIPLLLILQFGMKWRAEAKEKTQTSKLKTKERHQQGLLVVDEPRPAEDTRNRDLRNA